MTQRSGAAAMSVEICDVTATISPAGTAASAAQINPSRALGAASPSPPTATELGATFFERIMSTPQSAMSRMRI